MKPAWDQLIDEFKDSKTALVADVDCTSDGKALCEKHGVQGYPTIKYGDPTDLKDYEGGRDFNAFKTFADENLGPVCGPDNLDLCSDEEKAAVAKYAKMDIDELGENIEEGEAKIKMIEESSTKAVDKLQKKIRDLQAKIVSASKKKDDTAQDLQAKIEAEMVAQMESSSKAADELQKKIRDLQESFTKAADKLQKKIRDLQAKIEAENKKKDETVASTSKRLGLGTMRKVAAARKKKEEL